MCFNYRRRRGTHQAAPLPHVHVLKMLAVMEAGSQASGPSTAGGSSPSDPPVQEFLTSGRTGRRNALPDILGQHAIVSSSDLPARLQALSTKDQGPTSPSNQNEPQPGPSTSQSWTRWTWRNSKSYIPVNNAMLALFETILELQIIKGSSYVLKRVVSDELALGCLWLDVKAKTQRSNGFQ